MAAHNIQFQEEIRNNQRNTTASIKNLEVQMGKIAQQLAGSQEPGTLPSEVVINPREHNNVSVVVTRSGKSVDNFENKQVEEDELVEVDLEIRYHEKNKKSLLYYQLWRKISRKTLNQLSNSHILKGQRRRRRRKRKFSINSWRYSRNLRLTFCLLTS